MPMKDYTLTVREVMENLALLAESYETVSRGRSPTGNYFFEINVADMTASLKAALVLISQLPCWIPVSERLPDKQDAYLIVCDEHCDGRTIIVSSGQYEGGGCWTPDYNHMLPSDVVTHWMPLSKSPAAE